MRKLKLSAILTVAALLFTAPSFAQTASTAEAQKQHTDGNGPPMIGPGSGAFNVTKQRADGGSPTMVGPGSRAYKQHTQSMSHPDGSPAGVIKRN